MPTRTAIIVRGGHREQNARDAAKMYAQGATIREIAEQFGLSYGATHGLLRYAGVTFRKRGGNTSKS